MKISVIIPVYQVENYIERCLQSIISQDYKDFEIILVDDATKDNSMEVAKSVLKFTNIPVTYLTHKANKGLSAARNTGIRSAQGEYLLFIDSDDALEGGAIKSFVNCIDNQKADCIVGNYRVISDDNEYVSNRYKQYKELTDRSVIYSAYKNGDIPIMAWNKCVKKSLICDKKIYFKEGILHEDELWTFMLVNNVNNMCLMGMPTYKYFIRGGSIMTNSKLERKMESNLVVYDEMVNYIRIHQVKDKSLLQALDIFVFQRYCDLFKATSLGNDIKKQLYKQLRNIQKKKGISSLSNKYSAVANLDLLVPSCVGYHLMALTVSLLKK